MTKRNPQAPHGRLRKVRPSDRVPARFVVAADCGGFTRKDNGAVCLPDGTPLRKRRGRR